MGKKPISDDDFDMLEEMLEETSSEENSHFGCKIIVSNDDHNTFEWVITCLMKYCDHTLQQAEQCSMFIHSKGAYAVKSGTKKELKPINEALLEAGLISRIEDYDN